MSSSSEREQRLILDVLGNRISAEEFLQAFPRKGEPSLLGLSMLREALEERDPVGVEFGLYLAFRFGVSADYLDVLLALATADWHENHEDVVEALTELNAPESATALHAAALAEHEYLEYDEAHALGTKSAWALAKLQTEAAVEALTDLLSSGAAPVAQVAREQLERLAAGAPSPSVRDAARSALGRA
jgi:hypothetical protein